jgi:hypothetical protein
MEYVLKVSMHIRRIHRKYFSVYGDYGKFKIVCSTQNCLSICRKYLNVFGEYAKRIYAYMEKTQRDSWCIRRKLRKKLAYLG